MKKNAAETTTPQKKVKANPKHVAAARELRDRYLEQFNAGKVLPQGKYHVGVALPEMQGGRQATKALPVAA